MDELLDKVKGGVDELLDKVKGHHIETANELEKKIKRLQVDIEDLRCTLERLNSRKNLWIPTCPDLDEHMNAEEHRDSDSTSNNDAEPASFVTNVLAMDNIFGYFDVKELKKCRLICKDWNKAASSILSKRNNGNGLAVNLQLNGPDEDDDWDFYAEQIKEYLKKAQELHSVVKAAPENWFKTVNLEDNSLTRDPHQRVFQDFGIQLKVIRIKSVVLYIQTLRSILVDWCPNLEELGLLGMQFETGRELEIVRPLKLTKLSLNGNARDEFIIPTDTVTEVLFTIIKNSPNLRRLDLLGWNTTKVAKQIFSNLQNYPQIMNKMEEIFLRCNSCNPYHPMQNKYMQDPLEALSNIQFESKLKKLVLTDIEPRQSPALNRLLNMTSESLERLTVTTDQSDFEPESVEDPNFQLKQMNCLREFRYHVDREGPINSIDILVNMPNLKIFVLTSVGPYLFDYNDNEFIDRIFSNCRQLIRNSHQNLNELHLFGYIQNPLHTFDLFDVIDRGFPNLNKLVLGICVKEPQKYEDFSELFKGISKLKKLNKLFFDLGSFMDNSPSLYQIGKMFSYFKRLPNLIHLTMQGEEVDLDFSLLISKLPKLQRLTLIGVKMQLIKARQLGQLLDEKGIFLDIEELKRFREMDPQY